MYFDENLPIRMTPSLEACKEKCVSPEQIQQNHVPTEAQCLSNRAIQKRAVLLVGGLLCLGLFCTGYGILKGDNTIAWTGATIIVTALYFLCFLLG
jgi:hypothetical protein